MKPNPTRSALLVIDMENGFVHPEGGHWIRFAQSMVPNCVRAGVFLDVAHLILGIAIVIFAVLSFFTIPRINPSWMTVWHCAIGMS